MQEKIHIKPLNIDDINDKYICWVNDLLITGNNIYNLNFINHKIS